MSKRMVKDRDGYSITVEEDTFMTHKEAEEEIAEWWAKNAKRVKRGKSHGEKAKK